MMPGPLILPSEPPSTPRGLPPLGPRVPAKEKCLLASFRKVGFKEEGILREDHFSEGKWQDSVLLSVLSAGARPC